MECIIEEMGSSALHLLEICLMKLFRITLLISLCSVVALQSCSLIDDDLSVCGKDLVVQYQLQLKTSLNMQLATELYAESDSTARKAVERHLSNIFTDHAHDIDVMFFSQVNDNIAYHLRDTINDNRSTYTIFLPVDYYHHLSLANLDDNGVVTATDTVSSAYSQLQVTHTDTLPTQKTGIFAARLEIEVQDTANQTINVILSQVNSAVVLLIDTISQSVEDIDVLVDGTASGMMLRDSSFIFDRAVTVRAENFSAPANISTFRNRLPEQPKYSMFSAVCMPSSDNSDAEGAYFKVGVYVKLADSTVTKTELSVRSPLKAGQLMVLKTKMNDDGSIVPSVDSNVGATVTLDWKDGGHHDIEM